MPLQQSVEIHQTFLSQLAFVWDSHSVFLFVFLLLVCLFVCFLGVGFFPPGEGEGCPRVGTVGAVMKIPSA